MARFEDGLRAAQIIDAVLESQANAGSWVGVKQLVRA
jgi:hypothetical protein